MTTDKVLKGLCLFLILFLGAVRLAVWIYDTIQSDNEIDMMNKKSIYKVEDSVSVRVDKTFTGTWTATADKFTIHAGFQPVWISDENGKIIGAVGYTRDEFFYLKGKLGMPF